MDFPKTIKQFIFKHYPKDHLYTAGSLGVLFLLLLIIPGEDNGKVAVVPNQTTQIPIPITRSESELEESTLSLIHI